jgi:membrane-bound lytic murein transglycosylase F
VGYYIKEIRMDKYDTIIQEQIEMRFPELLIDLGPDAWMYIKAQIYAESEFNSTAVSPCGAKGLMQLMPDLCEGIDPFDPVQNIWRGVTYLAEQYHHFPEIPIPLERLKFSLASYNCGRGYINVALKLAKTAGDNWPNWDTTSCYLADPKCKVKGRHPDYKQTLGYVAKIIKVREGY